MQCPECMRQFKTEECMCGYVPPVDVETPPDAALVRIQELRARLAKPEGAS